MLMDVNKNERVILLASNVSGTSTRYRRLYRWLDDNAITIGKAIVGPHYHSVSVLKGDAVTREAFVTRVRVLAKSVGTQALDVFLNLHGERDALRFADGRAKITDLGEELADLHLQHRLRLLYSTCCWGARHAPMFVAAGFKTASGARGINANGPYDLPVQLTRWTSGATYAAAVRSANNAAMMEVHDRLARLGGFNNVDSFKEVYGMKSLRITSKAD
jgi:hypothetical protein